MANQPQAPLEESCYWLAGRTASDPAHPASTGNLRCRVAVVGGGLTGLWTALFLTELDPGIDVVIVEQRRCGYGASGRNAGILGETVDHSHLDAERHFGREEARRLAQIARRNLEDFESFLAANAIDCDYQRSGQLLVARTPAHERMLAALQAAAARAGSDDWRLLSAAEMRAEIHSPMVGAALLSPRSAILDPVKLVDGLRRTALERGVRILEETPVRDIATDSRGARISIAAGAVVAQCAILATNAYSHHLLPALRWRFLPLYDYILVSEPLSAAQKAAVGWDGRQALVDLRTFFNYSRLTADDRILWGTSEAVYYSGNRVGPECDHAPAIYRALERSFAEHFPQLAGMTFPYRWGGPIAATTRLTPFVGARGPLLYALGYTGHGLGTTRLMGKLLAHLALERPTEAAELAELALARHPPFPYPPEPLRGWAVERVRRGLMRVDRGGSPTLLLRVLERLGIGFSS